MEKEYDLIVTIVKKGQKDKVVEASRAGGAKGGTIIYGTGTGKDEFNSVLGVQIQPEREIVLTLASSEQKNEIMRLICEYADLYNSGNGLCFSLPAYDIIGSNRMLKEQAQNGVEEKTSPDETKKKNIDKK